MSYAAVLGFWVGLLVSATPVSAEVLFSYQDGVEVRFEIIDDEVSTAKALPLANYAVRVNGGYFDADFQPVGMTVIQGKRLLGTVDSKLSAFVYLDGKGELQASMGKPDNLDRLKDVFQAGPFVIDPGGKAGIRPGRGRLARRIMLGRTPDGVTDVLHFEKVSLYQAMLQLQRLKNYDWVVNLDGGPSAFYAIKGGKVFFDRTPKMLVAFRQKAGKP